MVSVSNSRVDDVSKLCGRSFLVERLDETLWEASALWLVFVRHLLLEAMHLFLIASCYY